MVLKELEKKNTQIEKLIGQIMIMIFFMINTDLMERNLVKMVIIYMDLIKMD